MTIAEYIGYSLIIIGATIGLTSLFFHGKFYGILKSNRRIPNEYIKVKVIVDLGEKEGLAMKRNKEILLDNQIPLNKICFVIKPIFSYDIDKNKINPEYEMMLPLRTDNSGLFDRNAPIIEISKPENLVRVSVNNYYGHPYDNINFIKQLAKTTKKGIVICLENDVDDEIIRLINLDEVVEQHNSQL